MLIKTIQEAIKEAHLVGLQSGKKETSGLVDLMLHKIEPMIDKSVEKYTAIYIPKYVNGHLVDIKKTLSAQDAMLNSISTEQAKVKMALNLAETITNPLLKAKQFWGAFFGGIISFAGFLKYLIALVLAIGSVLALFKFIQ